MPSEKDYEIVQILEEVLRLTERRRLNWQDSPRDDYFMTLGEAGGVAVERRTHWDEDDEEFSIFEVSFLNGEGMIVDSVASESEVDKLRPDLLPLLFIAARANARGSELFLKGFKQYLEKLESQ